MNTTSHILELSSHNAGLLAGKTEEKGAPM